MFLSDDFIKQYNVDNVPFGGNGLGAFVYLRTYSRWDDTNMRRENWIETTRRVVEYSMSLYKGPASKTTLEKEAQALFDHMFNLKVFPAGRSLWIGGTESSRKFPSANFNCSFVVINSFNAFIDAFWMLMVGAGVGFRILPDDINNLPPVNNHIVLANKPYHPKQKQDRIEVTQVYEGDGSIYIIVGDSKEGWVEALNQYFIAIQRNDIAAIIVNYDSVRAKGEELKTFGGRASGHTALRNMFTNIHKVIKHTKNNKLKPIQALDIMNFIGENVVVGGVRRTSEIALFDVNDIEVLNAKVGLFDSAHVNYNQTQRFMSNNSIFFQDKPNKETLEMIFKRINTSAEPGFVNAVAARRRRPNFQGLNPCAEILLDSHGTCNLTEINVAGFVTNGELDLAGLGQAIKLATRIGLRQTNIQMELDSWNTIQSRDRLTGVSLDGVITAEELLGWSTKVTTLDTLSDQYIEGVAELGISANMRAVIVYLRDLANLEAMLYAKEMRIPAPLLTTTIKPSGTLSQLPTISSGIHRDYAPFYVRRVRISSTDPLAKVMLDLGYPIYPENGQGPTVKEFKSLSTFDQMQALDNASTWVIEFPVKTACVLSAVDESATQQLKRYLTFQRFYTDHNTSITIYYSEDEVSDIIDLLLANWDDYIGVSFLPRDVSIYPLLPKEAIDENEYNSRAGLLAHIKPSDIEDALKELERENKLSELLDADCESGSCPVR